MARNAENRTDRQIETASKSQRWKEWLIAIGVIGSSLLIGIPIIGYGIKRRTKSLLEFFRIFRENPVWTMGFLGILIPMIGILYILARKITRKPHAHLLEGCIILAGLLMGIGFIAIQELL
mgnify:CR=1 FL=1